MMRNFALSTAAVSCTITWTGDSAIYTAFGTAGDSQTALATAAGTSNTACATQAASLLKDATIATPTAVNAICDAAGATDAEQIAALTATIATNIATTTTTMTDSNFSDCSSADAGKKANGIAIYSAAAAQVLSDNKADICPETSSASTVSVMAAIAALAIRLL